MTKPLRTEDEAIAELHEAILWYEQRRTGLGAEFLAAVEIVLDQIARLPQAGAPVPQVIPALPVRRAPVKRFPYQVVYLSKPPQQSESLPSRTTGDDPATGTVEHTNSISERAPLSTVRLEALAESAALD